MLASRCGLLTGRLCRQPLLLRLSDLKTLRQTRHRSVGGSSHVSRGSLSDEAAGGPTEVPEDHLTATRKANIGYIQHNGADSNHQLQWGTRAKHI